MLFGLNTMVKHVNPIRVVPDGIYPRQAFDRDGKGTLEVSDLEDLLGVLKAVGDRNVGSTGGGIETVMEDIDKDQSGQVGVTVMDRKSRNVRWQIGDDLPSPRAMVLL